MAGETQGELAEAIAYVALGRAIAIAGKGDFIFWEESPPEAVIMPDITIGQAYHLPKIVVLVNASESAKESEKKYWRNIAEIFDSKSRLSPRPSILNLVFRSEIKPELVRLSQTVSDNTHLVDRDPIHGTHISRWLESNHGSAPSEKDGKNELVRNATTLGRAEFDNEFAAALTHLAEFLSPIIYREKRSLIPLWKLLSLEFKGRSEMPTRQARTTLLRRGLSRWVIFKPEIRERVLSAHFANKSFPKVEIPPYLVTLGMLMLRTNGGFIPPEAPSSNSMVATTASDLRMAAEFFKNAALGDTSKAASALAASLVDVPSEMTEAASQLRQMPDMVSEWQQYVIANWKKICDPIGCFELLLECAEDGTMNANVPPADGNRVWLYDHLIALVRARKEQNNDFGYGALGKIFKAASKTGQLQEVLSVVISRLNGKAKKGAERWINKTLPKSAEPGRRGFQDWLAGKKKVSPVIVAAYAFSLSNLLSELKNPASVSVKSLVDAHAYSLWNKLLTHQDFEPLAVVIETACEGLVNRIQAETLMADMAERSVQDAGLIPAFAFKGGLICWKSVTDSGKSHKRKELAGRARALRYARTSTDFRRRASVEKLFLVVDGTFNNADLRVLYDSGWDEIFYPDEMERLVQAII